MSKKRGGQGKGHSGKHSGGGFVKHVVNSSPKHHPKHQHKGHHVHHKHHVHVKGKHGHHARGYAVGDLLPVCTFEALAMSLRLAGGAVAEDDLLELWWRAGEREVSIAEALAAAAQFGLAGCRPVQVERKELGGRDFQRYREADQFFGSYAATRVFGLADGLPDPCTEAERTHADGEVFLLDARTGALSPEIRGERIIESRHARNSCTSHGILGINTPGPHTVLATPGGWWSWGELWSPWPARIEEAWVVSWQ